MEIVHPGTSRTVWRGEMASADQVASAVARARDSLARWRSMPASDRIGIAQRFGALAAEQTDTLSRRISLETGKPRWEADSEAKLIPAKVDLSLKAFSERSGNRRIDLPQGTGCVEYRPTGVMAVLGPFNFPAHLPNGHIVPALIAGNTVVFKPSEMTAGTGELMAELWNEAGLPDGVLQVVQGDRDVGQQLVGCDIDGVLFTGSFAAGTAIHRSLVGRPHVLLALEMGGNNPLIVHRAADLEAAAYLTALSAYITAGQRCTCARRLILPESPSNDALIDQIARIARSIRVAPPDEDPQPFMGTLISPDAAQRVLDVQQQLVDRGAKTIVEAQPVVANPALLSPCLIDVSEFSDPIDEEVFGPILKVIRFPDFASAIRQANQTSYGLSASLLYDDAELFDQFRSEIRAGVVNWNQATIGASGRLPFGGLGTSGNHRPSGYFAADYCSDSVAILENATLKMPATILPGIGVLE